jgi:hypothetical protein
MIATLFVAASLVGAAAQQAPQGPPKELVLRISATPIYPDGKVHSWVGSDGVTSEDTGYLFGGPNPCTAGASVKEPDASSPHGVPGYGWRYFARVLQRQDDNLLVEIEWQRLWDQSRRIENGQRGSMQVSLHVGDRLPLDDIFVPLVAGCDASGMHLEASASERTVPAPGAKMSVVNGVAGARAAELESMVRSGAGATVGFGSGIASAAEPVNVDLWLVHELANGTDEEVQRMTMSASPSSQFRFPPITVGTAVGNATVEISGNVSAIVTASGDKQLRILIGRVVRDNPALNGVGSSVSAHPMPKPGEVYSFETPELRSKGEPVKSDRVSLRLRIAQKDNN